MTPDRARAPDSADATGSMSAIRVGALSPADHRAAALVLGQAFRDGPMSRAVVGPSAARRLRSSRYGARRALRGVRPGDPGGAVALGAWSEGPISTEPHGVLVALPPGRYPQPVPSLGVQLVSGLVQGLRVASRWGDVYRAFDAVHPLEPHWYLSLLGVLPARQRRGVGRALLAHWLETVDRDAAPSYLETDLPENVAFYASAGFSVVRELEVFGTPVYCLRRPAERVRGRSSSGPIDPAASRPGPRIPA